MLSAIQPSRRATDRAQPDARFSRWRRRPRTRPMPRIRPRRSPPAWPTPLAHARMMLTSAFRPIGAADALAESRGLSRHPGVGAHLWIATIATACSPSITSPLAVRSGHRRHATGKGVTQPDVTACTSLLPSLSSGCPPTREPTLARPKQDTPARRPCCRPFRRQLDRPRRGGGQGECDRLRKRAFARFAGAPIDQR
jgi:hypothetical protein